MDGWLAWRAGEFDEAETAFREAAALADQVGRSEVMFQALFALAAALRQREDFGGADSELARALDVCERAGLVAQSIEATSARATTLAVAGRLDPARDAADEASRLAERLRYPVGKAASLEAQGVTAEGATEAGALLAAARDAWAELGRPIDAGRCEYLRGRRLLDEDPAAATEALAAAAESADELGISHLARKARQLAPR